MAYLYVVGKQKEEVPGKVPEFELTYVLSDTKMPRTMENDFEERGNIVLQEILLPEGIKAGKSLEFAVKHSFLSMDDDSGL